MYLGDLEVSKTYLGDNDISCMLGDIFVCDVEATLIAFYTLQDTAVDSVGSYDGTKVGLSYTSVFNNQSPALAFSRFIYISGNDTGRDDRFEMPVELVNTRNKFSFSFWSMPGSNTTNQANIYFHMTGSSGTINSSKYQDRVSVSAKSFYNSSDEETTVYSHDDLAMLEHYCYSFDLVNEEIVTYINGVLFATDPMVAGISAHAAFTQFFLLNDQTVQQNAYRNSAIAHFRFYDGIITETQNFEVYNSDLA